MGDPWPEEEELVGAVYVPPFRVWPRRPVSRPVDRRLNLDAWLEEMKAAPAPDPPRPQPRRLRFTREAMATPGRDGGAAAIRAAFTPKRKK